MTQKRIAVFAAGLVFLAGLAVGQSITVITPNGGENWRQGSSQLIKWTATGIAQGTYKITLWRNGTNLGVVATGLPFTQHQFSWTVGQLVSGPSAFGPGFKIKIKLQEQPVADESNNPFNISVQIANIAKIPMNVHIIPKPDLIVCLDNNLRPAVGAEAKIHAHVKNIGQAKSNPCALSFYVGGEGTSTFSVPKLNPGESYTVYRKKRLHISATRSIHATIDSTKIIAESNENNNYVESSVKWRLPHEDKYTTDPPTKCSDGTTSWNP